ncbi:hypothetical protein [Acidocella sp.]|uniref:hypothetical protein n=1 Tax=Acidocella sp. TaxID=50710 RepID=UPI003CFEBA65
MEPRRRILKGGKLYFGAFSPTVVDCLVIDLTANGARVETPEMTQVPELFKIQIGDAPARRARRCWAHGNAIGLEFLDPHD